MKERFHNEIIFFIECIHESLDYFVVIKQRLITSPIRDQLLRETSNYSENYYSRFIVEPITFNATF